WAAWRTRRPNLGDDSEFRTGENGAGTYRLAGLGNGLDAAVRQRDDAIPDSAIESARDGIKGSSKNISVHSDAHHCVGVARAQFHETHRFCIGPAAHGVLVVIQDANSEVEFLI